MSSAAPATLTREDTSLQQNLHRGVARPFQVVVWNDPVNLMSYVEWVFRSYFGHSKARAHSLMLEVHEQGRAVVSSGGREKAEQDVRAMHGFGLQSTLEADQ